MREVIGWTVFYMADVYDVGYKTHEMMMHGTRSKARDQMRKMKAQPWAFSEVFMCRVVMVDGQLRYERAR